MNLHETPRAPSILEPAVAAEHEVADVWSRDGDSRALGRFNPWRAFASEDGMSEAKIERLLDELRSAGVERQFVLESAVASRSETYAALEWRAYYEAMIREVEAYTALCHAVDTDSTMTWRTAA